MTIIAAREYHAGFPIGEVTLAASDSPISQESPQGTFSWVGLFDPTLEEMDACAKAFGLHPLAVEDALHAHQLPKLEIYGEQLFVAARTAKMEGGHIAYGETAFFVGRHHIVTVRHGSDQGHSALRQKLEARPAQLAHGTDYVLHALLDMIADNYFPVIDAAGEIVQRLEQSALESALTRTEMRELFNLRRDLLLLQRMLIPMEDVCAKLASLDLPNVDADVRPYFRDVLDHVRRVASLAALHREMLNSVMETSALIEQQRQGDITRQLAAWAAILAVPTAIAGIYGMNFDNMPELRMEYAYFVVLGVIAAICVLLYLRFRKSGWL
ncbi:magnesium/cobalt transporter CorA [Altererythrobacter sp. H2]|uniref:magnesium/cobalt transporter CorA n=1 Tax=Altererythrobacter sp. H2 TaxID=3108391 RepID=UPI002AD89E91|nr:magnesium/cobalt transporter CorA [Altererythrobacter sp. H2]MDZ7894761.1 magnesium/cobalt transporter CorA [Sphingobium sp.]WRK94668.1 magnesium/cobalt transporter CorA [Altererythrobacter sp. H2]